MRKGEVIRSSGVVRYLFVPDVILFF